MWSGRSRSLGLCGIVAVFGLLGLSGCFRPETIDECQSKGTEDAQQSCIDNQILGNAGTNAALGGAGGALLGGGIGFFAGGPRGALIGTIAGGVTGAAGAGLITYYVEHQQADAYEDITARNRQLQMVLELSQQETERADAAAQSASAGETMLNNELSETRRKISQDGHIIEVLSEQLDTFKKAVELKYADVPQDISEKIEEQKQTIEQLEATQTQDTARLAFLQNQLDIENKMQLQMPVPESPST